MSTDIKKAVSSILPLLGCLALSAADFVRNSDFGEGTAGWSIPTSGLYKWERNAGINGSQGISFENTDLEKTAPGYPGQPLALKCGQQYRFSARVMAKKNPNSRRPWKLKSNRSRSERIQFPSSSSMRKKRLSIPRP